MSSTKKVILRDSEELKNIIIQVDFKNGRTSVFSGFSAWDNLAYIMEGLALTAEQCVSEGISKEKVYQEIKNYLVKALSDYQIIKD